MIRPTAQQVAEAVSRVMGTTPEAIFKPERGTAYEVQCRWVAQYVYWSWQRPPLTYAEVARAFGRDRKKVSNGIARLRAIWPTGRLTRTLEQVRRETRRLMAEAA